MNASGATTTNRPSSRGTWPFAAARFIGDRRWYFAARLAIAPNSNSIGRPQMLKLSEILVSRKDIDDFDELTAAVREIARSGERFFRMDVKPPYPDTPDDWEDRLEATFSGLLR